MTSIGMAVRKPGNLSLQAQALAILRAKASSPAGIFVQGSGYLQSPGNLLTWSNDLSNAAWGSSTATRNSATVATASGSGQFVYQAVAAASSATNPYTAAFVVSRRTGTGEISITADSGFSYTPITISSTPTLFTVAASTSTILRGAALRFATSGDSVQIDGIGIFSGTYTSTQLLQLGGIPLSTSAAVAPVYTDAHVYMPGSTQTTYGPELVTNGDFSSGLTGWLLTSNWSISGGAATFSPATGTNDYFYQLEVVTVGRQYQITYTLTRVAGDCVIYCGTTGAGTIRSASGTYTETITAAGNSTLYFYGIAGFTGTIDNISVREVITSSAVISGLASNNYLLSDGSTGYTPTDGLQGLLLDSMGAVTTLSIPSDMATWTSGGAFGNWNASTASGSVVTASAANGSRYVRYAVTPGSFVSASTTVVAGTSTAYLSAVFGTSGAAYISQLTTSPAASGTLAVSGIAPANAAFVEIVVTVTTSGGNAGFTNTTATTTSGIPATSSGASRPTLLRGAYNWLLQSGSFSNAAWTKTFGGTGVAPVCTDSYGTAPDGTTTASRIQFDRGASATGSDISYISQSGFSLGAATASIWLKTNDASTKSMELRAGSAAGTVISVTATWTKFTVSVASSGDRFQVLLYGNNGGPQTADILAWHPQYETGTTASDYTPTTSAAASNPLAGRYSSQYSGAQSLLTGNIGFTNAATIVIAGRLDSLSAAKVLIGEDTNGVQPYVNTDGSIIFNKKGVSDLVSAAAGSIVAGTPFVLTFRLSGGTAVIRKNGVQIASSATVQTFSATTGSRIGTDFSGSAFQVTGALGWVIPMPVALTDAECLTVERLVASNFPGAPAF